MYFQIIAAEEYNYLNHSGCVKLDGVDDAEKFDALRLAFQVVQINPDMMEGMLSVLSAILWLGNLTFGETDPEADGEGASLTASDNDTVLPNLAGLLGLPLEDLRKVVLMRQINIRGNVTEIPLKYHEAKENRHAMAKALYSR